MEAFFSSPSRIPPSFSSAIEQLLVAKTTSGRRPKYVKLLGSQLRMFQNRYLGKLGLDDDPNITAITVEVVEAILALRNGTSPATRASDLGHFSSLFSYARRKRWITENPCEFIERVMVEAKTPPILSLNEAERMLMLLGGCRCPRYRCLCAIRPWFVLCLFGGLRPSEAERLDWSKVHWATGRIVIDGKVAKTRHRRIVPMSETLRCWLALDRVDQGPVVPSYMTLRRKRGYLEEAACYQWKHDVLRHSYASYRLAIEPNLPRIAAEMGNSPGVLMRNYVELVMPEDAERFWALRPPPP
jgi:integrase